MNFSKVIRGKIQFVLVEDIVSQDVDLLGDNPDIIMYSMVAKSFLHQ